MDILQDKTITIARRETTIHQAMVPGSHVAILTDDAHQQPYIQDAILRNQTQTENHVQGHKEIQNQASMQHHGFPKLTCPQPNQHVQPIEELSNNQIQGKLLQLYCW